MVTQVLDGTVEFEFYRPEAKQMFVAGDFNGWRETGLAMKKGADGRWRCRLRLAPGVYHFRYVGDGQWFNDYAAFGIDIGPYGINSVLKVDPPALTATSAAPTRAIRLNTSEPAETCAA